MGRIYTVDGIERLAAWVAGSRAILLDFIATLKPEDYAKEVPGLGWGSIRNLLIHTGEAWDHWFCRVLGACEFERWDRDQLLDVAALRERWESTVRRHLDYVRAHGDDWLNSDGPWKVPWHEEPVRLTPAWALMHMFTHEFHHKGQAVTAARMLGYEPPETDLGG